MKTTCLTALLLFFLFPQGREGDWKVVRSARYDLYYFPAEQPALGDYRRIFAAATDSVEAFFGQPFPKKFDIRIHPGRASMDAQWRKDWGVPDFKSECWMVASGVAAKLDLLSPQKWATEACEHDWADRPAAQRLIAHELAHVFHGQHNDSPDFSDVQGLDWWVEGLAVYASGQCDAARLAEVKAEIAAGKTPASFDQFWTGKLRYGRSGSVVLFLDRCYGRQKLLELLPLTRKRDFFEKLGCNEAQLMAGWRAYWLGR